MALENIKKLLQIVILIYACIPVIFRNSPFIQRSLLFMNHFNTQYMVNLSHPEQIGIKCSRLLRFEHIDPLSNSKIELGAWHVLPESSLPSCVTDQETNRTSVEHGLAFANERPIVLYVHGNGGNRAGNHRIRLYKRLAYEHDYHIVTFDYRGYGDSTYEPPTADGLCSDASHAYKWLLKQQNVDKDRVIVWGHSLGTAVAVRMVAELPEYLKPSRLILEAPFDSLANAIEKHPFSKPFSWLPYFDYFFIDPIKSSQELNFNSIENIQHIKPTPVIILHAEDDEIIPVELGHNLYREALLKLGKSNVQFISIGAKFSLGHKHIYSHNETMSEIKKHLG